MRGLLFWVVRLLVKPTLSAAVPVKLQRLWGRIMGLTLLGPKGAAYRKAREAGVPVLAIAPAQHEPGRCLLYLHGGAYVMGGYDSHRKLAAALGDAAQARVWLPDYRLAPEHPHPAALEDALAVYSALLEQGQDPERLSIVGDSAGAGLTLALALSIREAGLPMPAALVLISPWVDMGLSGDTITTHAERDPMLSASWLRWAADVYRADTSPADAFCSPLYADLTGLPPILIQVGSEEILLSDAIRLHAHARAAGLQCELQRFDGFWHVFQLHYGLLRNAGDAIDGAGQFVLANEQRSVAPPSHQRLAEEAAP